MTPYFEGTMAHLKVYLGQTVEQTAFKPPSPEDAQTLLVQSMDTLGILARAVGPKTFAPAMAEECCKLGVMMVSQYDDPDVRKCAYSLFASVAFIAKESMA